MTHFPYELRLSRVKQQEEDKMNTLDLAYELNLSPKRHASTNGGEYKSKCPKCQSGTDRFCIWPNRGPSGRYWCRMCEVTGDGIQFCRDFLGLTFQQACQKVNIFPSPSTQLVGYRPAFIPSISPPPSTAWQELAERFILYAHKQLLNAPHVIEQLTKRGLTYETILCFQLGWNPKSLFQSRETWGLSVEKKENGELRRQWLPKGIVIPSFSNSVPVKIKVRRADWIQGDSLPKYIEISGSQQVPALYGNILKPVVVVESELDAILLQQFAAELACALALGGVSKKPDTHTHRWLQQSPLILLSLDFDEAGKKHCAFWVKSYPNLRLWPSPQAKSIGDAFQEFNLDLTKWVQEGLLTLK